MQILQRFSVTLQPYTCLYGNEIQRGYRTRGNQGEARGDEQGGTRAARHHVLRPERLRQDGTRTCLRVLPYLQQRQGWERLVRHMPPVRNAALVVAPRPDFHIPGHQATGDKRRPQDGERRLCARVARDARRRAVFHNEPMARENGGGKPAGNDLRGRERGRDKETVHEIEPGRIQDKHRLAAGTHARGLRKQDAQDYRGAAAADGVHHGVRGAGTPAGDNTEPRAAHRHKEN